LVVLQDQHQAFVAGLAERFHGHRETALFIAPKPIVTHGSTHSLPLGPGVDRRGRPEEEGSQPRAVPSIRLDHILAAPTPRRRASFVIQAALAKRLPL
jgi:hypothetical protein